MGLFFLQIFRQSLLRYDWTATTDREPPLFTICILAKDTSGAWCRCPRSYLLPKPEVEMGCEDSHYAFIVQVLKEILCDGVSFPQLPQHFNWWARGKTIYTLSPASFYSLSSFILIQREESSQNSALQTTVSGFLDSVDCTSSWLSANSPSLLGPSPWERSFHCNSVWGLCSDSWKLSTQICILWWETDPLTP